MEIDVTEAEGMAIDLRDRLRFAAHSLVEDFGEELSADRAEALVFDSAEGLLATASVTDFVPILAERRARSAVRSGAKTEAAPTPSPTPEPAPPAAQVPDPPVPPPPPPAPSGPSGHSPAEVEPMLAVPGEHMVKLRDRVEHARDRVSGWQADLSGR